MLSTKTIYKVLVLATGLLLILLPQINITTYVQPTITSKFIVFAFGCLVVLGSFIAAFVFSKRKSILVSKLDIALVLLIGYITLNRYGIQPIYGFSIRFLELIGLAIIFIILRNLSIKTNLWLLLAIIISGIIQAVYGNLQLLGYYPSNHSGFKLTGSFFNPGPYAGFLAIVWTIALGMYLFKETIREQVLDYHKSNLKFINTLITYIFEYIPLLGVVSIMLVIPASHSRGAWLAIFISSVLLLEFRYHYINKLLKELSRLKKTLLIALTIVVVSGSLFGVYHFKKGSADGRLFMWKITTEIIKDTPVFGVGFDRFKAHYMNYQADYFAEHGETDEALVADNSYYAFNDWLQFIAESGFIGLLLVLFLVVSIINTKVSNKHTYLYRVITVSILSISIFAMFSYPMQILPVKLIIAVLLALLVNLEDHKFICLNIKKKQSLYLLNSIKVAFLIIGFIGITKSYDYLNNLNTGLKTWKQALTTYQYGAYEDATEEFEKAYPILQNDGDFLMNYGKALSLARDNKKAVKILEETKHYLNTTIIETALGDAYKGTKQYIKAETAYQHAANMIPVRFYPLYLQVKLYAERGDHEKAVNMAKIILNKDIKVPSTAIKEIHAEMKNIIKNNGIIVNSE